MENSVPMGGYNARVASVDRESILRQRGYLCLYYATTAQELKIKVKFLPVLKNVLEAKTGERRELGGVRYRTGATYKRPDGMTLDDMSLCIGCYKCIDACPYGARYIHPHIKLIRPDREKDFGVGKCNFCQHRVDKGLEPACVRNCVGKARIFGDLNDPNSEVSKLIKNNPTKVLKPDEKTEPNIYYIKLDEAAAKVEDLWMANPKPKERRIEKWNSQEENS